MSVASYRRVEDMAWALLKLLLESAILQDPNARSNLTAPSNLLLSLESSLEYCVLVPVPVTDTAVTITFVIWSPHRRGHLTTHSRKQTSNVDNEDPAPAPIRGAATTTTPWVWLALAIVGWLGILGVLAGEATGGLERKQEEKYGGTPEYEAWIRKSWSGPML